MEVGDFVQADGSVRTLDSSFPVLLTRPGGSTIDPVRIALVESPAGSLYFLAWSDGKSQGPDNIVNVEVDRDTLEYTSAGKSFKSTSGESFSYSRSGGCGCGTMLRRWFAWPEAQHVSVSRASVA